ncbi:MAG: YceI family protein [Planctomycetota bacterium]|nr:YceI family protein [Planctomycetota bacterium]
MNVFASLAAAAALALGAASTSAASFSVDPVHSGVVFRVNHLGVAPFFGMFHAPKGTFNFDMNNPGASTLEITLDVEKIDSGNSKRDDHLKSPDFFNAKQFPVITFKGTSFEKTGDKTLKVRGDLTMLGQTRPVEATVTVIGEGETPQGYKTGFEAAFTIKRSEFGMTKYIEGNMLSDEITLIAGVEGKRE